MGSAKLTQAYGYLSRRSKLKILALVKVTLDSHWHRAYIARDICGGSGRDLSKGGYRERQCANRRTSRHDRAGSRLAKDDVLRGRRRTRRNDACPSFGPP